jgi:predicted Zn-dependent peptidase
MISAERYKLPPDHLEQAPRQFAAVTPDDVQRAARKHLHPGACCVAAAGPVQAADLRRAVLEAAG